MLLKFFHGFVFPKIPSTILFGLFFRKFPLDSFPPENPCLDVSFLQTIINCEFLHSSLKKFFRKFIENLQIFIKIYLWSCFRSWSFQGFEKMQKFSSRFLAWISSKFLKDYMHPSENILGILPESCQQIPSKINYSKNSLIFLRILQELYPRILSNILLRFSSEISQKITLESFLWFHRDTFRIKKILRDSFRIFFSRGAFWDTFRVSFRNSSSFCLDTSCCPGKRRTVCLFTMFYFVCSSQEK